MSIHIVVTPLLLIEFAFPAGGVASNLDWNPLNIVANHLNTLLSNVDDMISSAEPYRTGKQALAGYPFEVLSSSIDRLCDVTLNADLLQLRTHLNINRMSFTLMTPCQNYTFPLLNSTTLWSSSSFDVTKKTVLMVTGWHTHVNETNTSLYEMSKAYFCRGNWNFVAVDTGEGMDTFYPFSARNTDAIGEGVALGLSMLKHLAPGHHIHLIGHSLGAHVVGSAGRRFFQITGDLVPRITGLDPAKPCFLNGGGSSVFGLRATDAQFVDVIHSNPGVLGKREPLGHVDYYPGGLDPIPDGCITIGCAHSRAWVYYTETVYPGNEGAFVGSRCKSFFKIQNKRCIGERYAMGYNVSTRLQGLFYSSINKRFPFGLNSIGTLIKDRHECVKC